MSRSWRSSLVLAGVAVALSVAMPHAEAQQSYQRISGEGSSWAAGAIDAMRVNVKQYGITVDYNPSGSTAGRKNWLNGTVDFAASDIPFQFKPEDGSAPEKPKAGSYAYIPVTAGGTAFMYNLKVAGKRVTNLRLSGENVAKIFTGVITQWNDPALVADNPGLDLPARKVVPVVRSDGSGSSAQFTKWLIAQHGDVWDDYCKRSGRAPACGFTSFYPTINGMIAQSGDLGVAGYVAQGFAEGAVGYVNYSYALGAGFPVVKVLNGAGYYTEPTPENVAVSLLKARINTDASDPTVYLTQELGDVYSDRDPRSYQLSSYSYFVLPTEVRGQFNEAKGRTLGVFAYYAMCQAQQQSASLGYSPLPINLVEASLEQIKLIPGVEVQNVNIQSCKNPTFSADGTNTLAKNAPQPKDCDKRGASQCADGTAGARSQPTAVKAGTGAAAPASGGTQTSNAPSNAAVPAPGATNDTSGPTACDPDTGICGTPVVVLGTRATGKQGSSSEVADAVPTASSTVLPAARGWSGGQTLTLVIIAMTLALVLVPAWTWLRLAERTDG
jgi:phosphate transport system substrate-binding protein